GAYLWAPLKAENGQTFYHWTNMERLRPRDVVLHYADGLVRAIGEVTQEAKEANRPAGEADARWDTKGRLARVNYFALADPIRLPEIPLDLRAEHEGGPFTTTGSVKQGFLFELAPDAADRIRKQFAMRWPPGSPWHSVAAETLPPPEDEHSMLDKLATELF